MTYHRVIPRDLFNEASLLKCLGKLVLDIEDGRLPWLSYRHDGEAFNIVQNKASGGLYCDNVEFFVSHTLVNNGGADKILYFERPLNSRAAWPLYLETEANVFAVFDDHGNVVLTLSDCEG